MSVVFARIGAYPRHQRLDLYAGDGVEFTLTSDEELTGEVVAELRRNRADADPVDSFAVSVEGTVATITLDGDQTAALGSFVGYYDVQHRAEGAPPLTLIQGSVFCSLDVTRDGSSLPPGPFVPGYPISETTFSVDGPLADPWLPSNVPSYVGSPPLASGGNVTLELDSEGQTEVVGRPDLVPAELVGIRAANDWTENPWSAGVRLFLIGLTTEAPVEWYELNFFYTGTEWSAAAYRVTGGGATYDELIPGHVPDMPGGFPVGAAVAFEVEGTTLRYRVSVGGDTAGLFELGANIGQATLVGPFTPAFLILSDAVATGFFTGGPPED